LGADLLLVFQGTNFNTQIPAKIYEYLRAGRCIMALLDPSGDTAAQLRKFKVIEQVDIRSPKDISAGISRWRDGRESSRANQGLMDNKNAIQIYSRQAQTLRLKDVFVEVSDNEILKQPAVKQKS